MLDVNSDNFNPWWIGKFRPHNFIVIAISDPFSILLNVKDGKFYAMTSESSMEQFMLVASNFELFFRSVGSIFLKAFTVDEIIKNVGNNVNSEFWEDMSL